MIRKVAIAVAVAVLLVATAWLLGAPSGSVTGCKFNPQPDVSFKANHLRLVFSGQETGDVFYESKRRIFGALNHESRSLVADVSLQAPVEPGTFPIEGEAEQSKTAWSFRPGAANDPKIKSAAIHPGAYRLPSFPKVQVRGTLTIERASATELAGRLELSSPDSVDVCGPPRISSAFSIKLGPNGESVDSDY